MINPNVVDYYHELEGDNHYLILNWGSGSTVWQDVHPEDAARAKAYPVATMAYLLDARVDELVKFVRDDGGVRCTAIAKKSRKRCKNFVGSIQQPWEEWLQLERSGTARCHLHVEQKRELQAPLDMAANGTPVSQMVLDNRS